MDDAEFRERLKARYGFGDWPGREAAAAVPQAALRFALVPEELPGVRHEHRRAIPDSRAYTDFLDHEQDGAHIAVTIDPQADADAAHERLVDVLSNSMTVRLPDCRARGVDVGDVCFCTYADEVERVYFARGNVVVVVESVGERPVAVSDVAAAIDAQILAARG